MLGKSRRLNSKNLLAVLATSLLSVSAFSADLYVATNGSDSNPGSPSQPLKTIQRASALALAGTTVHVAAGTYNGNVTTNAKGTATARVRFISDTKWGAKIIGTGTEAAWTNNGNYVDITGFDVSGSGRLGILNLASFTLISYNNVHDLKVSGGCTGSGGAGIVDANYSASDDDIIGNVVHDIGVPGGCNGVQGIYHSKLRGKIANNIVYRASPIGIHLWHAANKVTIVNNTVFANGSSRMGGGIVLGTGDSPGGIVLDDSIVSNNIVYNNPASGIVEYCYSGQNCIGSRNIVSNNLVYGNGGAISLRVGVATGTISADPLFVNYQAAGTSGDYHLKSSSPAIDRGTASNAPSIDMDGVTRPQGAGIDIGAYEFKSSTSTPPPTTPPPTTPPPVVDLATVKVNATNVIPGAKITVTITNPKPQLTAWAALYVASNADSSWSYKGNWMSLNGLKTTPAAPIASATLTFIAPMEPGVYNIRLFANDGYATRVAISPNITVAAAATTAPGIKLSTSVLKFGSIAVNKASVVQFVKITNSGNAPLKFASSSVSGEFAYGNLGSCTPTLAVGASCTYSIKFLPKTAGSKAGTLLINTNAPSDGVIKIKLTGIGI